MFLCPLQSLWNGVITGDIAFEFIDCAPAGEILRVIFPFNHCFPFAIWLQSISYTYKQCDPAFLTFEQHYQHLQSQKESSSGNSTSEVDFQIFHFEHLDCVIQLVASFTTPIADVLKHSPTKALQMSIITHNRAYCLFPQSGLIERRYFCCKPHLKQRDSAVIRSHLRFIRDHFGERSTAFPNAEESCSRQSELGFQLQRSIADDYCAIIEIANARNFTFLGDWIWRKPDDHDISVVGDLFGQYGGKLSSSVDDIIQQAFRMRLVQKEFLNNLPIHRMMQTLLGLEKRISVQLPRNFQGKNEVLLDPHLCLWIFHLTRHLTKLYRRVYLILLLQTQHYYDNDDKGYMWLNIDYHLVLNPAQKSSDLDHWNVILDALTKERINLQFEWSWGRG
ncbi:hypothetical protein GYMLUDRAFT_63255 [Collybiopsis luxurians FD-317 M1]|uniref:Uncharacterized protein n=1 Tax=Collybiopsis luxurians FD-317 M1 TaxID=944289 RepID=A0A0D0BHQ1_9AGAR|nr:hypothetical protein GYMLUDRAFT_63255 [Collybiopsis luxurians FD-317 M1]